MKWMVAILLILVACAQQAKVSDENFIEETEKAVSEVQEIEEESQEVAQVENETQQMIEVATPVKSEMEEKKMGNTVTIETTMGTMKIRLYDDKAPKTTKNFKDLVSKGFYDGTIFHRVIKNFMIQGGDPTGTGTGGPGYKIPDEFGAGLKHDKKGILSMANAGPNSGGSQFFITLAPTPWLDGRHAIFGEVIEGVDVLDKIGAVQTDSSDRPKAEVKIVRATIV